MWTFRVAVAIGGRGVDANLRILQVLKGAWRIVRRVALPNCARKRRGVVQFPWELAEGSVALVVGGTDTSRRTGPQLVLFQCLTPESSGPGSLEVRARRTFHDRRPVQSRVVAVQGRYLQLCSSSSSSVVWLVVYFLQLYPGVCPRLLYFFSILWKFGYVTCELYIKCGEFLCVYTDCGLVSLARLQPVRGRRTRIKYVIGLTGLAEAFRHKISGMADRRDCGGGGDDPKESTQRMIERIWESLTDIWARMDQQAPVPPVAVPLGDGEAVPVAPVLPRVEVPFAAPVPPPPPVLIAEEPVMQVEKFLRLQPPTYSGGPNPDTAEHWVHEVERVFATMRCPAADKVVLAAYQLRDFALEWWRLKMQTTFAGRTEQAITWSEFLDVFNDTFFPIQVQQVKREQFRTLQQGLAEVFRHTCASSLVRSYTSRGPVLGT
ncbi:hypothetical protein Taro_016135 [Colocasia esculenta]|uniref:Retrotransposon gag domain-containing protein n=1 Tax=Colocasia esculenta TaxID=4460 RepID=A0A843US27_COLES|nr:hypothetical protein [Colocasia esculenta]